MVRDVPWDKVDDEGVTEGLAGSVQFEIPEGCAPLFGDRALARALYASLIDEASGQGDAAEARRNVLRSLLHRTDGLMKRAFVPDDTALERVAAVGTSSPNAIRAIEVVYHAAALAKATRSPLRVPPILLHGPPGSGKTRVARALVRALALPLEFVSGSTTAEAGGLCGYGLAWRNPGMGLVAKALIAAETLAVAVVVDEIDKAGSYIQGQDTRDGLLPLLEPSTAANWTDDWLGAEMRADGLVWIMTCNDLEPLSAPLRDRCIVVEVSELEGSERQAAIGAMLDEIARESRLRPQALPRGVAAALGDVSLRRARTVLRVALGMAATAGREELDVDDVRAALGIVGDGVTGRRTIGFVR